MQIQDKQTRRNVIRTGGVALMAGVLAPLGAGCAGASIARAQRCEITPGDIEGPFYRAGAPFRSDVRERREGVPLVVEGCVLRGCQPLAGAEIDLWQADHEGAYDLTGFGLRARIRTDANGRYRVSTLMPGHYMNGRQYRPAHLHVKVRAQGIEHLTTQLYFEGDPYNASDAWFHPARALHLETRGGEALSRFDFAI